MLRIAASAPACAGAQELCRATTRTRRIFRQSDRPHRRFQPIENMQLARRVVAEAGEQPYRLHRGEAAHQAAQRAEYALRRAVIAIIGVVRVADEAAVAGAVGMPAGEGTDLAVELTNCCTDQRDLSRKAEVVHDKACGKIIAAVDNDVDICQDFG